MNRLSLAGIKVKVHPTFWLVAIAAAVTGQFMELITLFSIVIMHELGHVFTALALGWRVVSIELLPFGGVAKVDEWGSTKAMDEIKVALAGPFVNGAMIVIGFGFWKIGLWDDTWSKFFMTGNAIIACFNLLPIWPLDGGKVLQAILSKLLPYYKTIHYCIFWSCLGLFFLLCSSFLFPFHWNLVAITIYLLIENWLAWKQSQYVFIRFLLMKRDQQTKESFPIVIHTIPGHFTTGKAVKLLRKEKIHQFYVLHHQSRNVEVVTEEKLLASFFEQNPRQTISELITNG